MSTYNRSYFILDNLSSILCLLTTIIFILRYISSNIIIKYNNFNYNIILWLILISLYLLFISRSILSLYIYFEFRILPIFFLIIGYGYQTERVRARLALIFYTITASIPLLIIILNFIIYNNLYFIYQFNIKLNFNFYNILFLLRLFLAFLVKLPIFLGHLWLPKAHVEAPVVGSIILAAILLKLGGYGVIRFSPLITTNSSLNLLITISLTGSALIGFICLNQLDLKVIIAYSSVAHIGLVIRRLLYMSNIRLIGGIILIIAHGITSSSIFFGGNLLYIRRHSRRILLNKGILSSSPLISFFWLFTIIRRIAAPPFFNLISEILCITSIVIFRKYNIRWIIYSVFLAGAYSIVLYSRTQQSYFFNTNINIKSSNILEIIILFTHIFWRLLIILRLNLFIL